VKGALAHAAGAELLVDQPTEHRPAPYIARTNGHSPNRWPVRDCERQASVRPLMVVMARIGPQDPFEVAATEHQDVVEALGPDGLDPPFGVCVGLRRPGSG
jgi:hypothetical protein